MAEATGEGGGSHRDATRSRPRVQQLRPTNKDVPIAVPAAQTSTPDKAAVVTPSTINTGTAPAQPKVVPRIVTGQGGGSAILVNNCQVRRITKIAHLVWKRKQTD